MHLINGTFSRPADLLEAMCTVRRHMEVTRVWIRVASPRPSRYGRVRVIIADEMHFTTVVTIPMRSILHHRVKTRRKKKSGKLVDVQRKRVKVSDDTSLICLSHQRLAVYLSIELIALLYM